MEKVTKTKLISMLNRVNDIDAIIFVEKDLRKLIYYVENEEEFIVIKKVSNWNL